MKPAIAWRNPKPRSRKHRWQLLDRRVGRALYVVQELVRSGDESKWFTTCAFEVVQGGRVPASSPRHSGSQMAS